ncbi:MAG TPA: DUF2975 domain-containing protein [Caulobacteraceae bacterium]|jgi:hypothetical protein
MRALGPGSVSSFLKVILDVFHFVLWIAVVAVTLAIVAALLLSFRPDWLSSHISLDTIDLQGPWLGPMAAGMLLIVDLYLVGGIIVVDRLRNIFRTLIGGDPFHPDNARRLRIIGAALAVLELGRYAVAAWTRLIFHGAFRISGSVSLTTWFAILVIVVLSEVFREGARLRGEAELTI